MSVVCQEDPVSLLRGAHGKALLQKLDEGIDVGGTENSAQLQSPDTRILDDDLALVIAGKLRNSLGKRRIAEDKLSRTPAQVLFDVCRTFFLNHERISLSTGDRTCRQHHPVRSTRSSRRTR